MRLKLVSYASPDHFPKPIEVLFQFLQASSGRSFNCWPLVADFFREVLVEEGEACWKQRFEDMADRHFLRDARIKSKLWELLRAVYSLKLDGGKDPRGRFLEYVVYKTLPYVVTEHGESQYECAVHEDLGRGRTRPVVNSTATFDAAFLNDSAFEGHECKANAVNFLCRKGALSEPAQRKLQYMRNVSHVVQENGQACHLFLVSFHQRPTSIQALLAHAGFSDVRVLGAEDIERRLVA